MAMSGESKIRNNQVPLPDQRLVYDWLNEHKINWRVYHQGVPFFAPFSVPGPAIRAESSTVCTK